LKRLAPEAVGSFYYALLNGLIVLWLIDPESIPSGRDLADALLTITRVDSTTVESRKPTPDAR
jgi:hypothetical protein